VVAQSVGLEFKAQYPPPPTHTQKSETSKTAWTRHTECWADLHYGWISLKVLTKVFCAETFEKQMPLLLNSDLRDVSPGPSSHWQPLLQTPKF
jgi:hypothetical protein